MPSNNITVIKNGHVFRVKFQFVEPQTGISLPNAIVKLSIFKYMEYEYSSMSIDWTPF